jgi:hypothetical protein
MSPSTANHTIVGGEPLGVGRRKHAEPERKQIKSHHYATTLTYPEKQPPRPNVLATPMFLRFQWCVCVCSFCGSPACALAAVIMTVGEGVYTGF